MTRTFRFKMSGSGGRGLENGVYRDPTSLPAKQVDLEQTIEHIESIDPCDRNDNVPTRKWIKVDVKSGKEPERGRSLKRLTAEEAELQQHAKALERALYDKLVRPEDEKRETKR